VNYRKAIISNHRYIGVSPILVIFDLLFTESMTALLIKIIYHEQNLAQQPKGQVNT
jgi:hypothetical protein